MDNDQSVKKVLISLKTKAKFYITNLGEEFVSPEGLISSKDLNSNKEIIETDRGNKLFLLNPLFPDLFEKLNRAPQIVTHKDVGLIIAKTGVNKNSTVVDAGAGSGSLSLSLANICKQVTCYDINKQHLEVVEKNKILFNAENLIIKEGDVAQKLEEKDVDLITLDLPHPWKVVEKAENSLKRGGFLVVYLPNLLQMKKFYDTVKKSNITYIETIELMERQWKIEENIMRPETRMIGHTGFMMFCRKL